MKVKQLSVLFTVSCVCLCMESFAQETTRQAEQESDELYNRARREPEYIPQESQGPSQPQQRQKDNTIREDVNSGNQYVIPFKESNQYWGNPEPQVLDTKPNNPRTYEQQQQQQYDQQQQQYQQQPQENPALSPYR